MPIDYTAPPSAYYYFVYDREQFSQEPSIDDTQPSQNTESVNETPSLNSKAPALSGNASFNVDEVFNAKAIWGPIGGRMVPSTKKTLSKIMSQNIRNMSEEDYEQLRYLIEYIATHPESKQHVFDLTGFNDNDLAFAEKYFRKYESRKMFSKLVEFALSTSSNGKVSKQVSGLVQFIFETGEINGQKVPDSFKFQLLRGIPELLEPVWQQVASDCNVNGGLCSESNKTSLDLNADQKVDAVDIQIANSSLDWLRSQLD
jgi:hypothetical protein